MLDLSLVGCKLVSHFSDKRIFWFSVIHKFVERDLILEIGEA